MIIEAKLVEQTIKKIDDLDERAKNTMADGMLQNFGEYRFSSGYRKALADCKILLNETLEDILKE